MRHLKNCFNAISAWTANGVQLLIVYAIMLAIFGLTTSQYMTVTNFKLMAANFSIGGIVAVGAFFVMLAGVYDLSISGVVGLVSVLIVLSFNLHLPIVVVVLASVGLGCLVGCLNGFLTKVVGINPLITTIGTGSVLTGLAKWISTVIGSENIYNAGYRSFGSSFIGGTVPVLFLYMLAFFVLAFLVLRYTPFGRNLYAVGGSFEIARMAGIRSARVQFGAYVISGAMAAVAAILLTSQLASGRPEFGTTFTLDAIAVCVLGGLLLGGGKGDLFGLFVAVILLGSVANGLIILGFTSYIRFIVTGSILILSIIVNELRYRRLRTG
jgi:ribose/xylose/arabinose/galactoside ABC-type transport system permease subunit